MSEVRQASTTVSSRIYRLARKELRETLRDRRTIITLILMPILLYPVLGVTFRKLLITNVQPDEQLEYAIVLSDEREAEIIQSLLIRGKELLEQQGLSEESPVFPTLVR